MFKKLIITFIFFNISLFANTINIAVAANVSYAIKSLKTAFNAQYPHTKIKITLGSSGKLTAQIRNGAPFDLFMSANMLYPNTLFEDNLAISKPAVYAQGSLAILSTKTLNKEEGLSLLTDKKIKRIAIANPKTAPYGKASIQALKNAQLYNNVKHKLVYGESIAQTVSYTFIAADVGLIATSSLYSPKMKQFKKDSHWKLINTNLYTPIDQGIVILKHGQNSEHVKKFYDFIFTQNAQKIFKEFGYTLP